MRNYISDIKISEIPNVQEGNLRQIKAAKHLMAARGIDRDAAEEILKTIEPIYQEIKDIIFSVNFRRLPEWKISDLK